jgi:hypothetical protein
MALLFRHAADAKLKLGMLLSLQLMVLRHGRRHFSAGCGRLPPAACGSAFEKFPSA